MVWCHSPFVNIELASHRKGACCTVPQDTDFLACQGTDGWNARLQEVQSLPERPLGQCKAELAQGGVQNLLKASGVLGVQSGWEMLYECELSDTKQTFMPTLCNSEYIIGT